MTEPCLCGAVDCPRCFPALLDDYRRKRDEWLAEYRRELDYDAYYDEPEMED